MTDVAATDPFIEVITDTEFNAHIVKLCCLDFENTEKVMDLSISYVTFICGETHSLFYSDTHKVFHILKNGKKELPGYHCPSEEF